MARTSTMLADALSEALGDKRGDLRKQYARAITECDDAWDAVEGALSSRLFVLASEAHGVFRGAYRRKLVLHSELREAEAGYL